MLILDLITLKTIAFTKIIGNSSGSIMTSTFTAKSVLLLSPAPNFLLQIDCAGELLPDESLGLPRELNGTTAGEFSNHKVLRVNSKIAHPENYFLGIADADRILSANESGFVYHSLSQGPISQYYGAHSITCCGLATNSDETMLIVGDFLGNAFIYSTQLYGGAENEPIYQTFVGSAVRSIDWHPSAMSIAIGTMDGHIYKWGGAAGGEYSDFSA